MKKENQGPVVIKLSEGIKTTETLRVYLVDTTGKITKTTGFKGDQAVLDASVEELDGRNKVYIAQALPEGTQDHEKTELMLQKMGAYEVVKNFSDNTVVIKNLPPIVVNPFPFFNCLITGHVSKYFNIDGQSVKLPLCHLRVHICEVETELRWPHIPIYYRPIPDWIIREIGEKFANLPSKPTPPDPVGPISFVKRNLPLRSLTTRRSLVRTPNANAPAPLPDNVLNNMRSGSVALIRQTMIDHHDLLYPYLCLWPFYWPWIYVSNEITYVNTDCNGHFELWKNTFGDKHPLNIYIWIEANINGQWVTIYRPPLPCHTWWNYKCGTDINITVTDSRVGPCDCGTEGPADAVWFRSIGLSASALHIEQDTGSTITLQSATLNNGGCTDIIEGQKISPFGGGLALKLFCGSNIFNAGVTHYRWKKTMVTDANQNPVSGSTTLFTGNVSRPYLVQMSTNHYETHYCTLGAEGSGTDLAYRIPHSDVTAEPVSSLQDPADTGRNPEWVDLFFDSAYIDSRSLTDGIYTFQLELLQKQADGSFTPVSVQKATFQVSEYNTIGNSQDAPDKYLNINSGNTSFADSFTLNVRIDNAVCTANIQDAQLDNGTLSGPCGFIIYNNEGQNVHISFEASHPRDFASFSFGIVKGNGTQPTGITPSGYVLSSVGGFTLSGGLFGDNFSVHDLLNGCPGQAAFSENLHVYALATDGTNRLEGYDAGDVNAFALSNV